MPPKVAQPPGRSAACCPTPLIQLPLHAFNAMVVAGRCLTCGWFPHEHPLVQAAPAAGAGDVAGANPVGGAPLGGAGAAAATDVYRGPSLALPTDPAQAMLRELEHWKLGAVTSRDAPAWQAAFRSLHGVVFDRTSPLDIVARTTTITGRGNARKFELHEALSEHTTAEAGLKFPRVETAGEAVLTILKIAARAEYFIVHHRSELMREASEVPVAAYLATLWADAPDRGGPGRLLPRAASMTKHTHPLWWGAVVATTNPIDFAMSIRDTFDECVEAWISTNATRVTDASTWRTKYSDAAVRGSQKRKATNDPPAPRQEQKKKIFDDRKSKQWTTLTADDQAQDNQADNAGGSRRGGRGGRGGGRGGRGTGRGHGRGRSDADGTGSPNAGGGTATAKQEGP